LYPSIRTTLTFIIDKEHVQVDEATMALIMKTSGGDMRKAVTYLQSSHQLSGKAPISIETVIDISGQVVFLEHIHIQESNEVLT
jgi:replication factor C subunit 2/4